MPSNEQIDKFKPTINFLANEEKWRSDHNEVIDEIYPLNEDNSYNENIEDTSQLNIENNTEEQILESEIVENSEEPLSIDQPNLEDLNLSAADLELPETDNFDTDEENTDNTLDDLENNSKDIDDLSNEEISSENFDNISIDNITDIDKPIEDIEDQLQTLDANTNLDDDLDIKPELANNLDDDLPSLDENNLETPQVGNNNLDDDLDIEPELTNNLNDDLPSLDENNLETPQLEDDSLYTNLDIDPGLDNSLGTENIDEDFQIGTIDDDSFEDPSIETPEESDTQADFKIGDFSETDSEVISTDKNSDDFQISDQDLQQINAYLNKMPKNLKVAILEIMIDDDIAPVYIQQLCDKILIHSSLKNLANLVRDISGETVTIPKAYNKSSGLDFEKHKQSLSYVFLNYHWKPLKQFIVIISLLWVFFMTSFYYIYRPIQAEIYYAKGYAAIDDKKFSEANDYFNKGLYGWYLGDMPVVGVKAFAHRWFLKYIDSLIQKQQLNHAKNLFQSLIHIFPDSSVGYLAYGTLLQKRTLFEEADNIYNNYLYYIKKDDQKIMIAKGDNLLEWASIDPSKYSLANRAYSDVLSLHGESGVLNARFLNFAILAKIPDMIWYYAEYFKLNPKELTDPQILTNLAGYYIDTEQFSLAISILNKSANFDFHNASTHYQFGRYYKFIGDLNKQKQALETAKEYLYIKKPFTRRDLDMAVDTRILLAGVDIAQEEIESAQKNILEAIDLYEDSIERRVLTVGSRLGKLYKDAGDLYFYHFEDDKVAEPYYNKAIKYYENPDLEYNLAVIKYAQGDLDNALTGFYTAYNSHPEQVSIMFSLATTFAKRGTYGAAESFYNTLVTKLENDKISFFDVSPQSDMNALLLATYLIKTYNNLGIVYYNLSLNSPNNQEYLEKSYESFSKSIEAWDYINREVKTLKRKVDTSIPQSNQSLIYSRDVNISQQLQMYEELPRMLLAKDYNWTK